MVKAVYARVIKVVLGAETGWEAQRIVDVLASVQRKFAGFINVKLLADYENGDYVSISFWETKENAMAAYQSIRNQLKQMIGDSFQWEPSVEYFEVYTPKEISLDSNET